MNPKTKLGLIVLAFRLLREEGIPAPRVISEASEKLGVSRKTGYASAREIREQLERPSSEAASEEQRAELARAHLKLEVLRFERDNPPLRFSNSGTHLPAEARSLCVRLVRKFSSLLSLSQIAASIGVALSSLRRWDREADPRCEFPEKPENRGVHRRASPEDVERVLEAHRALTESLSLEEFTSLFNSLHPGSTLDRKTISKILAAYGERPLNKAPSRDPPYRSRVAVHFPGAQLAVDATTTSVYFSSDPTQPLEAKMEVAIDIASSAIVGRVQGREETSEGVERVLFKASTQCEEVLAILADNGSANRSARIKRVSERESELGQIFSFPYHPWTNGHIEGLFGQFSRIVGRLRIDDSSRESIAESIMSIVWRIFVHFHNYSPRRRLGGLSPLEYLRRYVPETSEREAARRELTKQRDKSRTRFAPNPRLEDPQYHALIDTVLDRTKLEIDVEKARKALLSYDESVIRSAANALFVAAKRDGFDERKRSFAYFMGIVRNKQREIDTERLRSQLDDEKREYEKARAQRAALELEKERQEEQVELERRPEQVVLKHAQLLLRCRMRLTKVFGPRLRSGLEALEKIGRATRATLTDIKDTILAWSDFDQALKLRMIELIERECDSIKGRSQRS